MEFKRNIVTAIQSVGAEAKYDASCKRILSNRYVQTF